jgi:hypothetical protein
MQPFCLGGDIEFNVPSLVLEPTGPFRCIPWCFADSETSPPRVLAEMLDNSPNSASLPAIRS